MPTDKKVAWCKEEVAAGLQEIEATWFVPPKVVPQFTDAAEVARELSLRQSSSVAALVPNFKGAVRGFDAGVHKINYVLSASEAHNLANVRRPVDESIADFKRIIEERNARGLGTKIVGAVATAFGCTIQGLVPEREVLRLVECLTEAGSDEIALADTVGYANPTQDNGFFRQPRRYSPADLRPLSIRAASAWLM